jgi:3-oxoacyl-[acyl-carrier-protein] synthase-3
LDSVGIGAIGYHLPSVRRSVEELMETRRATSGVDKLHELGYDHVHVAEDESTVEMAKKAVADLQRRSGFDLERLSLILYGTGLGVSSMVDPGADFGWMQTENPLPFFKFAGTRMQSELGLKHVPVIGVNQLACNAFQGSLRLARALIAAEPSTEHVLCIASDRFPVTANREIVYNLMSDGACAAVVSRNSPRNRILASSHITRGVYWDGETMHDHLVSGYFPLSRQAVMEALAQAGLKISDLALFIPHNINQNSWAILGQILGLPPEKVFTQNIARIGHVVASDNLINYLDALELGLIKPGDKVALFVTGFGAHWTCMIIEV